MTAAPALAGLFSSAELEALEAAADGMPLDGWVRHVLLTTAGQPDELDEIDAEQSAPTPPSPVATEPVDDDQEPPSTEPTLAEIASKLDQMSVQLQARMVAMGGVLEHTRDTQLEWQKAIFAEICAHTAFPDERARRLGLAKAERDTAAATDRIAQAVARARHQRSSR